MILYSYFRSSAAYRVRLGLAIKGITPRKTHYVNLRAGEQRDVEYRKLNPQGLVPALVLEDGSILTQSEAILEYLDEAYPDTPQLLPKEAKARAFVRSVAQLIACELQPLQNLRVTQYLEKHLMQDDAARSKWLLHWIGEGMGTLEALLARHDTQDFCHGIAPGLAECFILPQIFAARRFGHDMEQHPHLLRIEKACLELDVLKTAHPSQQPDAMA